MKKTICFVSSRVQAKCLQRVYKKFGAGVSAVPYNLIARGFLEENGIPCTDSSRYTWPECSEVSAKVMSIIGGDGDNLPLTLGVETWDLIEVDFRSYFTEVLWHHMSVDRIISVEEPDEVLVIVDGGWSDTMVSDVCAARGIPVRLVNVALFDRWVGWWRDFLVCSKFDSYAPEHIAKNWMPPIYNLAKAFRAWQRRSPQLAPGMDGGESGRKKIVYVAEWLTHLKIMVPLLMRLNEKYDLTVVVREDLTGSFKKMLRGTGIRCRYPEQYIITDDRARVADRLLKLKRGRDSVLRQGSGVSLLYRALRMFLSDNKLATLSSNYVLSRKILVIDKPDLMILSDDYSSYPRAYASAASTNKIPVVCVPHFSDQLVSCITPGRRRYATKTIIMGDAVAQTIHGDDMPSGLVVAGSPFFDRLISKRDFTPKDELLGKMGIDPKSGIIVLTTQGLSENEEVIKMAVKAIRESQGMHLIIKVHPQESVILHKRLIKKLGLNKVTVIKDISLPDLINSCELLVTMTSITAFEAIILDKPVAIINHTAKPLDVPYVRYGAAFNVSNSLELTSVIDSLADKRVRESLRKGGADFLADYLDNTKTNSTEKIVSIIGNEVLGSGR